jgi:Gpi18-like mannosyltransferase
MSAGSTTSSADASESLPPRHAVYVAGAILLGLAASLLLSYPDLQATNWDIDRYVEPWVTHIRERGGLAAFGDDFANYTPPYLYALLIGVDLHLHVPDVVMIKLVNIAPLAASAVLVYFIVYHLTRQVWRSAIAAGGLFILPTVILNAFVWGQADLFYSVFVLAAVLMSLKNRPYLTVLAFACSIAVKLQGIFLAPFILFLIFDRQIPWRALLLLPFPYLAAITPPVLLGRPFSEMIGVYFGQASFYHRLSMNAVNLYYPLQVAVDLKAPALAGAVYKIGSIIGLLGSSAVGLAISLSAMGREKISADLKLKLATFTLTVMPFVLPKMHDRYFFPAELCAYVLAWVDRRFLWVAVILQVTSSISYLPALAPHVHALSWFSNPHKVLSGAALLNTLMLVWFAVQMAREMRPVWQPKAIARLDIGRW